MKRLLFLVSLIAALLVLASGASSAPTSSSASAKLVRLEVGDRGRHVKDLQWLLGGHKPSVYKISTFHRKPNGVYGRRTARAVKAMKWRLGYRTRYVKGGHAGPQFLRILLGKQPRPLSWIGRASARTRELHSSGSLCARDAVRAANSQVGVTEHPWGSNSGSAVSRYQSVTGAYHAAWCASFAQWVLRAGGYGTIANRSAGVYYIVSWAHRRAWVHANPKVGSVVGFLSWQGHMGVVTGVSRRGFTTVEGNSSNGVRRRWYPRGYRSTVFIWVPCHRRVGPRIGAVGGGVPPWLIALVLVASAVAGVSGARLWVKRQARKAVHEIGELADDLEEKLDDGSQDQR